MPLDAVCLRAVVCELSQEIVGARIDKIYQPSREEIVFLLRGRSGGGRLLLSSNPARPRIQMTKMEIENPPAPPMLCMLLRKHLAGGRITNLVQPSMERVVMLTIQAMDELGEYQEKHLILEAMGRHSNLILTDSEGRIVDCLHRVDMEMSAKRQVLPGLFYHLPPAQEKENPMQMTEAEQKHLLECLPPEQKIADGLLHSFSGLSPLLCREVAYQAAGDVDARLCQVEPETLAAVLCRLLARIEQADFIPCLLLKDDQPKDFTCFPVRQYEGYFQIQERTSFSALLDEFYARRETKERMSAKSSGLHRSVVSARERTMRRMTVQKKELADAENRDTLRIFGDLITSNIHQMHKGMDRIAVVNYYDEAEGKVEIPLDPLLTPQQNAARYYKKYQKAKTAAGILKEQIQRGEADLIYLDSVLDALSKAEREQDLQEIREELQAGGYVKISSKEKRQKKKQPISKPLMFRSSAGRTILVGKNNVQNDQLTLKTAFKSDWWFHVQKRPGSHVILQWEGMEPDDQSVLEAAQLAAYFSSAREGNNVPVDYTPVRYVKKPNGARPGMVIYETYQTAYVTPEETLVEKLREKI